MTKSEHKKDTKQLPINPAAPVMIIAMKHKINPISRCRKV